MPIDIDRFEDEAALHEPSTSERVLRFLLEHDDGAYRRGEIADVLGVNPETVGTNLTRLKARGLVRHREPYWAVTDDRDRAIHAVRDRHGDVARVDADDTTDRTAHVDTADGRHRSGDHDGTPSRDQLAASSSRSPPTAPHRAAAAAFFERVRDQLDTGIDALYLFGSVAGATATADSDVDVLAVVSEDADYATIDDQLLDLAYDVQLDYGVRVEVHSIRAGEFAARTERGDPFIRTVVREGETSV